MIGQDSGFSLQSRSFEPRLRRIARTLWVGLLPLFLVGVAARSAAADEPEPAAPSGAVAPGAEPIKVPGLTEEERDREAESIARSIMSPFCPGRTISSCPVAGPWRSDIRTWVGEGVPPDEIHRRLAARVPDHDLTGVPPNALGAALPIGLGLLAVGALGFLLRYLIRPRTGAAAASSSNETKPLPNGDASGARPAAEKPENWDERIEQELDTLEQ
jgi:cytochrome c-type biogenesis protein CcmH/NrfF